MENKKVPPARCVPVGGPCAPDSRALTSDLGSSRLSRGGAATFYPGCPARAALLWSRSPSCSSRPGSRPRPLRRQPLPLRRAPREGSPPGNPRPAPLRPHAGPGCGERGGPGRPGGVLGAAGAGRARGGGRLGLRPCLGRDLLTAIGPLVPRPLFGRAAPALPQNPGEETGWLLSPPPFNFFFPSGGGRTEGEADLQTPRRPQPSSESIVTRGPAAPFSPRYLSPSPLAARLAAVSPRACAAARPASRPPASPSSRVALCPGSSPSCYFRPSPRSLR